MFSTLTLLLTYIWEAAAVQTITFHQHEQLYPVHGVLHFHQAINLSQIQHACEQLEKLETQLFNKQQQENLFQDMMNLQLTNAELERQQHQLSQDNAQLTRRRRNTCESIPMFILQHQRQRRGFLSVLGTIFGWFGLNQLTNLLTGDSHDHQHTLITLHKHTTTNTRAIQLLQDNQNQISHHFNNIIHRITDRINLSSQILAKQQVEIMHSFFEQQLSHIEQLNQNLLIGLMQALRHELSPLLINPMTFANNFHQLHTQAH